MLNALGKQQVLRSNAAADSRRHDGAGYSRGPRYPHRGQTIFAAAIALQGILVIAAALGFVIEPAVLLTVVLTLFFSLGIQVMRMAQAHPFSMRRSDHGVERESDRDLLEIAAECMPLGLVMYDASKRLIVANDMYRRIYDIPPEYVVQGIHLRTILEDRYGKQYKDRSKIEATINEIVSRIDKNLVHTRIDTLNSGRRISIAHKPLPAGGWVSTHEDVTERYQLQEKMRYLAHHDYLTGLRNRAFFWDHLQNGVQHCKFGCEDVIVYLVDLDHFKEINDQLGHDAGDFVLKEVSVRLQSLVRRDDIVARLGGDEFVIVQSGDSVTRAHASTLAIRAIDKLTLNIGYRGEILSVGASIGIALASEAGGNEKRLMKCADIALYKAKNEGKNCFRFYDPLLQESARSSLSA